MNKYNKTFFVRYEYIFFGFILIYPFVELLQGYIYKSDISKAITNAYVLFLIFCFLSYMAIKGIKLNNKVFLFNIIALLVVLINGLRYQEVTYDITAIFRSFLLAQMLFFFFRRLDDELKVTLLIRVSSFVFYTISAMIIFSYLTGFGLYTYDDFQIGAKSFFQSINELTFVYISSWICLNSCLSSKNCKIINTCILLGVFLLMGNKSFIPLIVFYYFLLCFFNVRSLFKIVIISCFLFFLLVFCFLDGYQSWLYNILVSIIELLSGFSMGASKILSKLEHLDVVSVLLSERNMLWQMAIDLYKNEYSFLDTLIGTGLSHYGMAYGVIRGLDFSFSEGDIIDLFMSYGLLGVFIFCFFMYYVFSSCSISHKLSFVKKSLVMLFIINGAITGHVYFFSFSCLYFSVYTALMTKKYSHPSAENIKVY